MANSFDPVRFFRPLGPADDKYSHGVVGFVTGSANYPGAAILGVQSAIRAGAGLVRYWGNSETAKLVVSARPEVVLGNGRVDCWVLGSGVRPDDSELADRILQLGSAQTPLVIDAGALEIVDFSVLTARTVLTPHASEMVKLLARFGEKYQRSDIDTDPATFALLAANLTGQTVLLKGHQTFVASDSQVQKVGPNSPHLATAGSGDVLAGLLGAIIARNASALATDAGLLFDIAIAAVKLHSAAATAAAAIKTVAALDVAEQIGVLLARSN